jgi:hypothetical protein
MVEMVVQLPYDAQDFFEDLQKGFKKSVAETAAVQSIRVQIKDITTMQNATVNVSFSIRVPQDTRAGLNFRSGHGKAEGIRASLDSLLVINARLLANGVRGIYLVLQAAVVVLPTTDYSNPQILRNLRERGFCLPPPPPLPPSPPPWVPPSHR